MNLATMQSMLGRIYDTPIHCPVDDYLLTHREQLPAAALATEEQLLVGDGGDTLFLSLFVDAAVLDRLADHDGAACLQPHRLADWLTAFEGVSHFQYLTYHATFDRSVSMLELELQAEVDKYVGCLELLRLQSPRRFPVEVLPQLFSARYRVDPRLPATAAARYRAATRGAEKFCRRLDRALQRGGDWGQWRSELRRFYRWPVSRKLALIEAVN